MLNPNSPQAQAIADLFFWSMVIGGAVFLLVTGLVIYVVARYRRRKSQGEPAQYAGNKTLEITWTILPALLLVGLFVATLLGMRSIDPPANPADADIVVRGYSWWWHIEYPKAGVVTANEIRIPVGQQILLRLESGDVIHNFWIPELNGKKYMIPGQTNTLWLSTAEPGVYEGACAEYCGTQHAWMRVRVIALPQAEYEAWLQQQQQPAALPAAGEIAQGAQLFQNLTCVNCHAIGGTGATAQVGPNLTHLAGRATLGAGILENTPENLASWIVNPQAIKRGVQMPGYQLTDDELRALVAYLGSLE